MGRKHLRLTPLLVALALSAGCTPGAAGPVAGATATSNHKESATPGFATQVARMAGATVGARATATFQETQALATKAATRTALARIATSEAIVQATAAARPMSEQVRALQASGILTTYDGTYTRLPDFDASWANINHYDFLLAGHATSDFVAHAELSWESASDKANWWNSGCGFVFRMNARGDHYLAFLGLDGRAYLYLSLDGALTRLGAAPYGAGGLPQAGAELTVVVQGQRTVLLVDGTQVLDRRDGTLALGVLGYALASGTNKDFGTRCRATGVEVWDLIGPP